MHIKFYLGFVVGLAITTSLCSCSTKVKGGSGIVSQQVVACVNPEQCQKIMARDCKKGGIIHRVAPAIAVQYSCNP
jgi:hypothetical protein